MVSAPLLKILVSGVATPSSSAAAPTKGLKIEPGAGAAMYARCTSGRVASLSSAPISSPRECQAKALTSYEG